MRGSRKQKCPLKSCEARSRRIKAHVYRRHLPDCFELSTDEHRHRKINTRLDMLARFVLGSDAQTSALCAHLNTLKAIPAQAALHPTDMLIPDMRAYCRFRNIPIPETFSFHPINCGRGWSRLNGTIFGVEQSTPTIRTHPPTSKTIAAASSPFSCQGPVG